MTTKENSRAKIRGKNSPVYRTIINYMNTNVEWSSFRVFAITMEHLMYVIM